MNTNTQTAVNFVNPSFEVDNSLTLNDFVFNLAPKHSNDELFILLTMEGYKYSEKSVRWYASKARSGVRR